MISYSKQNFYNDNDASSYISYSSVVKKTCPSVCEDLIGNRDLRALYKKLKQSNHSIFKS